MSNTYKCSFCGRGYQRKIYYSRHVAICELMCKSVKELRLDNQECDDTPSVRALYDVILEMAIKMSAMEKKMNEMSKWVDTKKRKINIIDWLNINHKGMTLTTEDLIASIKVERRHLEYLFKEDYTGTILLVLKEMLPLDRDKDNNNPIKAFECKPNTLYVYTGEGSAPLAPRSPTVSDVGVNDGVNAGVSGVNAGVNGVSGVSGRVNGVVRGADGGSPSPTASGIARSWIIMPDALFPKIINVVMKQLLDEFIIWQKENAGKMDQDDFAVKYANNARKIMGGSLTREQIYSRVKLDLYKCLKQGVPPFNPHYG